MKRGDYFSCQTCPTVFYRMPWEIKQGRTRFCSKTCCDKSKLKGKYKKCQVCDSEYYLSVAQEKARTNSLFCSKSCAMKHTRSKHAAKNVSFKCKECNTACTVQNYRKSIAKFCSNSCKAKYMGRGDRSHFWKGGVTRKNKLIRNSARYRTFRKAVMERDNYTCTFCRKRGGDLHVDHILPFAYFKELRFETTNGRTLCVTCHRKTATYGYNVNTWMQSKKDGARVLLFTSASAATVI